MLIETIISLLTLTILEIVLGIDNLVFIALLSQRVKQSQQKLARRLGLLLAVVTRLLLLATATWMMGLTQPLFTLFAQEFSIRTLLLAGGGIFLLIKGSQEIHATIEPQLDHTLKIKVSPLSLVIFQIALFDIIFSLDSVFTAVSMTTQYWVMATAIIIAILIMLLASEPLSKMLNRYPTLRLLALSFLLLLGVVLIADAFAYHIPRGYIYFAIAFSLGVESLRILMERRQGIKK